MRPDGQGVIRNTGSGPGTIDLKAALSRADARAVWRYMPRGGRGRAALVARFAALAGSNDAGLTLRGDLNGFPFLDKTQGEFLVNVKARDVVLDYGRLARIDGIDGDCASKATAWWSTRTAAVRCWGEAANTPKFPTSTSRSRRPGQGGAEGPMDIRVPEVHREKPGRRAHRPFYRKHARQRQRPSSISICSFRSDEKNSANRRLRGTYSFKNNEVTVDSALPPIRSRSTAA